MVAAATYIFLATWPLLTLVRIYDFGHGTLVIDVVRSIAILLIPATILTSLLNGKRIKVAKAVGVWVLILASAILNFYINGSPLTLREIVRDSIGLYMVPLAVYFALTNLSFMLNIRLLVLSIILSGIITAGVGLSEWVAGRNLIGPMYTGMESMARETSFFRTNGPFIDGISYSTIVLLHIPFVYYFMKKRVVKKKLWLFCACCFGLGCLVTLSRATLIALLLTAIILTSRARAKSLLMNLYLLGFGGIVIFAGWDLVASSRIYSMRLGDMGDVTGRFQQNLRAMRLFLDNPLFGIGYGNWAKFSVFFGIHNSFVAVLTDSGIVGFALFILYHCSILLKGLRELVARADLEAVKVRMVFIATILVVANAVQLLMNPDFALALLIMFAIFEVDSTKAQPLQRTFGSARVRV